MPTRPASTGQKTFELERVGFPRILFALLRQRFTGMLQLTQAAPNAGARTVWFKGGMPLFTDWVSADDILGELLVARGLISSKACDEALNQANTAGTPIGTLLVAAGRLDDATLSKALRLQCSRKLLHMFALRSGRVTIDPGTPDLPSDLKNPVNVLQLIRTGVQLHYDEGRVRQEMGDAADAAMVTTDAFQRYRDNFGFRDEDAVLLREFSKGTQVDALVQAGHTERRSLQLAYILWGCQMLIVGPQAASAVAQIRESVAGPPTANLSRKERPKTLVGLQAVPMDASSSSGGYPVQRDVPAPASLSGQFARSTSPDVPDATGAEGARAPSTPAEKAFEARVAAFEQRIADQANAFALLGVPLDADRRAVRAAWNEVSKDLHPDRLVATGMTFMHDRVEAVFAALSEANATLSNKQTREDLREIIQAGGTGQPGDDGTALMRQALEAEVVAREGERLLRAGNYPRALEKFQQSLELSDSDPNVKVYESWCRYQIAGREEQAQQKALRILQTVAEDSPGCASAHYYIGLLYIHANDFVKAKVALSTALTHNPRLTDAERQIRAIQIRMKHADANRGAAPSESADAAKPKQKSGGFRGLFGKK